MSYISRFLIMLLGCRDFSFESTLYFIEIYSEVMGSEGSNIMFRMNGDVWMIFLIHEEQKNTSSSTQSIVVRELCKK